MSNRKSVWRQVGGLALMGALGGVVGAAAAIAGIEGLPSLALSTAELIVVAFAIPILYLFAVAMHELGHMAGATLVSFRTLLYIAGPLRIEWGPNGRRVGFNRSMMLAGGLVASAPRGIHDLRRRTVVMVAGGPIASLIVGVQFLALWQVTSGTLAHAAASFPAQLTGIVLLAIGLSSLLIGIITLFPTRSSGFYSDGARLLRLLRGGEDVEREVALMSITGLAIGGTRPRDWDRTLMQHCEHISDGGPFEVAGRYYVFLHSLDAGDTRTARTHADFVLEHIGQLPKGGRASLLLAIATFHALIEGDADRARALVRDAPHALVSTPHQRVLADAAILFAEADHAAARERAHSAIHLAASAIDRGSAQLDVALAQRIIDRVAAAAATS